MGENTDHNDLAQKRGLKAVKKSVDSAIDAAKGQVFAPFEIMAGGVFWNPSAKKEGSAPEPLFFCSFIRPLGLARIGADLKGAGLRLDAGNEKPGRRSC